MNPPRSDWAAIAAAILAGFAVAAQIGKVPAAMTTIAAEFGLHLAEAALLVSLLALLAGIGGLAIGLSASRIGARRALLMGLAIAAAAATLGALAPAPLPLFAARIVEGAGFLLVAVSAPSLVAGLAAPRDRAFAMGLWGTFMPGGIAIGLATAPIVEAFGWRVAWLLCAALLAGACLLCWRLVPHELAVAAGARPRIRTQLREVVAARRPVRIAGTFAAYNLLYFGIAAFLPAYLESLGARTGPAGVAGALVAVANVAGNLAGAALMRRGAMPESLIVVGAVAMALFGAAVFLVPVVWLAVTLAILGSAIGGLVPAACFALVPTSVPQPALVPPAMGVTIQANNLVQLLSPPALGALAGIAWGLLALPLLLGGGLAAVIAMRLARDGLRAVRPSP